MSRNMIIVVVASLMVISALSGLVLNETADTVISANDGGSVAAETQVLQAVTINEDIGSIIARYYQ